MPDPLVVAKPKKPVSEMTDDELDEFAEAFAEALAAAHADKTKPE